MQYDPEERHWRERGFHRPELVLTRLTKVGIPKRYLEADLEQFPAMNESFEQEASYYIHGPVGRGKTHLLCAMVKERALSRWDKRGCLFITADDLFENIKSGFKGQNEAAVDSAVTYYKEMPILAIDDLGMERITDWTLGTIAGILNHRYNEMLITYIASNLDLEHLANNLSERIAHRLQHMCQVIKAEGQDRRLTRKETK